MVRHCYTTTRSFAEALVAALRRRGKRAYYHRVTESTYEVWESY